MKRYLAASVGVHVVAVLGIIGLNGEGSAPTRAHQALPVEMAERPGKAEHPETPDTTNARPAPDPEAAAPAAGAQSTSPTQAAAAGAATTAASPANADEIARIRSRIESTLHYPVALRRRGISGTVGLAIVIADDGSLESVTVARPSSYPELDELALAAARDAAPFARDNKKGRLELSLPVEFRIGN